MSKVNPVQFFAFVAAMAVTIEEKTTKRDAAGNLTAVLLPETAMVQFADETGWFTDGCSQGNPDWEGVNNFAGLSPNRILANYPNQAAFVDAYVQAIEQQAYGFPEVLAALNPILQMTRLGRSEWAGSNYDAGKTGRPGVDLIEIYNANKTIIEQEIGKERAARSAAKQPVAPPAHPPAPTPASNIEPGYIVPTTAELGNAVTEVQKEQFGIKTMQALGATAAQIEAYLIKYYGYTPAIAATEAQQGFPVLQQTPGMYKAIQQVSLLHNDGTEQILTDIKAAFITYVDHTSETVA